MRALAFPPGESNPGTHRLGRQRREANRSRFPPIPGLRATGDCTSTPDEIRTRVNAVRGHRAGPLHYGGVSLDAGIRPEGRSSGEAKFVPLLTWQEAVSPPWYAGRPTKSMGLPILYPQRGSNPCYRSESPAS